MKHRWFQFFPTRNIRKPQSVLTKLQERIIQYFFFSKFHVCNIKFFKKVLFVTRVSYWHLCLSIVVGRLWETQSPVRCAIWDPTYNIMYAGSMCLQPRQLCYNIATNQSFAKWNRNKEKLHLFPVSSLFRKLWKMFESFSESTGPKWRNLKYYIYRVKEKNAYYCVHDFLPRGNKTNEKKLTQSLK